MKPLTIRYTPKGKTSPMDDPHYYKVTVSSSDGTWNRTSEWILNDGTNIVVDLFVIDCRRVYAAEMRAKEQARQVANKAQRWLQRSTWV